MTNYVQDLNPQQKQAVTHTGGPLRVVAGAGTGKTRVLTHRIAYLVDEKGVDPEAILALTFTNKAASEMKNRVGELVSADTLPTVSTFHALGAKLLRRHAEKLPVSANFSIRDQQQTRKLVKQAVTGANHDPDEWKPKKVAGFISKQKSDGLTVDQFRRQVSNETGFEPVVADIWPIYRRKLRDQDSVDFADLLLLTKQLLEEQESIRRHYQNRWRHILVDEYQDTNRLQADVLQLLTDNSTGVFVVGDGDQTIYTWRGATTENIFSFESEFEGADTIVLSQNYRSTETILSAANSVIAENEKRHDKDLHTSNSAGDKIDLHTAASEQDEASRICHELQTTQDTDFSDWAILYRTNAQSRVIEEALLDADIPYDIAGTSFFDRKEVRDLLAYLRLALNREAQTERRRIISRPRRGIGKKTVEKIVSGRTDALSAKRRKKVESFSNLLDQIEKTINSIAPGQAVKKVISLSGLKDFYDDEQERIENMKELVSMASNYDTEFEQNDQAMRSFLQNVALTSDQDQINDEGVNLMTVHAAKGLEFPAVWITGLEDELFPQKRENETVSEEERRLFYVALTRAERKLVLSYAQSRQLYGSRQFKTPSPFLDHIDDDLIADNYSQTNESTSSEEGVIFFD